MPFNVQPELEGDTVVVVTSGATNDVSKVMFFAFDVGATGSTISNEAGAGHSTTTSGDTTIVSTAGTAQSNVTTEGLGSSFFGDTNEGAL